MILRAELLAGLALFACLAFGAAQSAAGESPESAPDLHLFKSATKSGLRAGYINHLGSIVIPARFEDAGPFLEGRAAVKISGRWGSIDSTGKVVVPATYSRPLRFEDGLAPVTLTVDKCNYFKYVDRNGKTAMPVQPGSIAGYFSGGLALVQASRKVGYVDKAGKLVIPVKQGWEDWAEFSDHLAPVKINGNWGFINNRGRFVIPPRFQAPITYDFKVGCIDTGGHMDPLRFSEKLAAVGFGGKAGFIDWSGSFVIAPRFDAALPFSDGMARVRMNGKWGYVDRAGKMRVAPRFEVTGPFSEGLAPVKENGLWGYIDKDGAFALPLQFKGAGAFKAGLAVVEPPGKKLIYIDKQGRKVWDYPETSGPD